jgi:polysaccharide pyruvyl transferase WcaK-like protein
MAIEEVRRMLKDRYQIQSPAYQPDSGLAGLLARSAALDYIVTCRFHGVVLAHMLNKPVLALAHHPKVSTAMADLGLSEYCFDIADFTVDQLSDAFARMISHSAEIKQTMELKLADYLLRLNAQYDELFPPVRRVMAEGAFERSAEVVGRVGSVSL